MHAAGIVAALAGVHALYHQVTFGQLGPPGARLVPFMGPQDIYAFHDVAKPRYGSREVLDWQRLDGGALSALETLVRTPFIPLPALWFVLCCATGIPRQPTLRVCWVLSFVGAAVTAWAAHAVFAPWRTLHTLVPVFVLVGAHGLDRAWNAMTAATASWRLSMRAPAVVAVTACMILPITSQLEAYEEFRAQRTVVERWGDGVAEKLRGAPVLASEPWYAMANLQSPVVAVPDNGENAMVAAATQSGVRYLLIVGQCPGASRAVCKRIQGARAPRLGELRLERVLRPGPASLYLIQRSDAAPKP